MATTETTRNTAIADVLWTIALIGAINWGLIGFFNWNLVDAIFGGGSAEETSTASRVVYAIVGLSGLAGLLLLPRMRVLGSDQPRLAERPVS